MTLLDKNQRGCQLKTSGLGISLHLNTLQSQANVCGFVKEDIVFNFCETCTMCLIHEFYTQCQ